MTRIDGASGIAALIRAQVLEQARRRQAQGQKDAAQAPGKPVGQSADGSGVQARLLRRINGIDASDPDRRRKAFRMFMESTLARELGESMQSDPQFAALVDQVLERMQADPQLDAACLEAADILLDQAGPSGDRNPATSPR